LDGKAAFLCKACVLQVTESFKRQQQALATSKPTSPAAKPPSAKTASKAAASPVAADVKTKDVNEALSPRPVKLVFMY
jgi:hypothetical protein